MKFVHLGSPRGIAPLSWHGDSRRAFTMIEIAISLAVIAFALVAIIGVLPTGMNVQKENREETIINQDASVFINAIRNGARGADDLTNYVVAIRRVTTRYDWNGPNLSAGAPVTFWYTNSSIAPAPFLSDFPLTNGAHIVGILSTPKYVEFRDPNGSGFFSNYIVAYVKSMSGMLSEKAPQNNPDVRDLAFSYRMIVEGVPYIGYDSPWTNYNPAEITDTNVLAVNSNYWRYARNMQGNLHDLRLTFRWPALPGNRLGDGRQTFRTMMSGGIVRSNHPLLVAAVENTMFFYNHPTYTLITNAP